MKFYVKQHKYYCGVDLHTRSMYVCIIYEKGAIVKQKNMGRGGCMQRPYVCASDGYISRESVFCCK